MNSNELIREKQKLWATRKGVQMRTDKYRCSYTLNPDQNVFKGLSESTKDWFKKADGHELEMKDSCPPKMTAVYSSSALCVNVFQYFLDRPELACALFQSCKLIGQTDKLEEAKMQFECIDYPIKIGDNTISTPNIDLVAELTYGTNKRHIIAESKFTEPYSGSHNNFLSHKYYTNKDLWTNLDLLKLYEALNIDNIDEIETNMSGKIEKGKFVFPYKYLDATQLLKHLLGAACTFKDKRNILLVYLWYDAWGTEGVCHRNEIEDFRHIVEEITPIRVRHITYQELIVNLWNKLDHDDHSDYLNYIADRYL